jgi:hypothetical protein
MMTDTKTIEYGVARLGSGRVTHLAMRTRFADGKVSKPSAMCGAGERGRGMTVNFSICHSFEAIVDREERGKRVTCKHCGSGRS